MTGRCTKSGSSTQKHLKRQTTATVGKQLLVLSECLHAGLPAYGVHGVAGWSAGTLLMLMLMLSTSNSAHPQIISGSSSVNWMPPCCHCLGTANPTGGYLAADGGVRERQLNFSSAVCSDGLHCLELREHTNSLILVRIQVIYSVRSIRYRRYMLFHVHGPDSVACNQDPGALL